MYKLCKENLFLRRYFLWMLDVFVLLAFYWSNYTIYEIVPNYFEKEIKPRILEEHDPHGSAKVLSKRIKKINLLLMLSLFSLTRSGSKVTDLLMCLPSHCNYTEIYALRQKWDKTISPYDVFVYLYKKLFGPCIYSILKSGRLL